MEKWTAKNAAKFWFNQWEQARKLGTLSQRLVDHYEELMWVNLIIYEAGMDSWTRD